MRGGGGGGHTCVGVCACKCLTMIVQTTTTCSPRQFCGSSYSSCARVLDYTDTICRISLWLVCGFA